VSLPERQASRLAAIAGSSIPLRAASILVALVPFAFGVVRAARTGQDLRYLWVALAALMGAAIPIALGRRRAPRPATSAALAAIALVLSTVFAMLAARLLGTAIGLGMLVVASAFGLCFAVAGLLDLFARAP